MIGFFSRLRNLISISVHSRVVIIIFSVIILLAVPLTVYVAQQQQQTKQHASFISPAATFSSFTKDYQQLILEKLIDPATQILEVGLSYDASKDPQVSFLDSRILNGYVPYQFANLRPNTYSLQELDENSFVLYRTRFEIPNDVHADPNPDGTMSASVHTELKRVSFVQTIPYYSKANSIIIHDPQGKIIAVKFLKDTVKINNKPNFRLINGKDIVQLSKINISNPGLGVPKLNMNNLIPIFSKAFARETTRKINVAFIGDGSKNYEKDVEAATSYLFSLEPFHTRASQFNITYIHTDSYLDCTPAFCDLKSLMKVANEKGLPYDAITIIVPDQRNNNWMYGASIMYRTSDKYSPSAWAHELGHAFGHLHDEYTGNAYSGSLDPLYIAKITNQTLENCYGGTSPSSDWVNLAGTADYTKGCTSPHLYRSSENSIMKDPKAQKYYNAVSQKIINKTIDQIAGPFTEDRTSPQVQFVSTDNNLTLSKGNINIKAQASDDRGVAYVQLWIDNVFLKTSYVTPYDFLWDASSEKEGPHTLQLKAYDVSGNMGQSEKEYVLTNNKKSISDIKITLGGDLRDGMTLNNVTRVDIEVSGYKKKYGDYSSKIVYFVDGIGRQGSVLFATADENKSDFHIFPNDYSPGKHSFYVKFYPVFSGEETTAISDTIMFNVVNSNYTDPTPTVTPVIVPSTPIPILSPFPFSSESQNISFVPPEPTINPDVKGGKGVLAGYVFLTYSTVISDNNISCTMYIFLKDSSGNEIKRLSLPVSKDMGRQAYKFDNLDTSKDYLMVPIFFGCDGKTYPPKSFKSKETFNNLLYSSFQDFIITYLSNVISTPTISVDLHSLGDANGNSKIDRNDYDIWINEITGNYTTKKSDFNGDRIVNTNDYNIWRDSMNNPNLPH